MQATAEIYYSIACQDAKSEYIGLMKMAFEKNKRFFEQKELNVEHLLAKTKSITQVRNS